MAQRVTWEQYRESIGDRSALFAALVDLFPVERALYPGSYVDLSPSTVIPSVTYVDTDRRASRFFDDVDLVRSELLARAPQAVQHRVDFIHGDYTDPMDPTPGGFDLLISLFTGPMAEYCRPYLRDGGWLLANASHGDASLAALDPSWTLVGVVQDSAVEAGEHAFAWTTDELDTFLIPKRPREVEPERIHASGRGLDYTRPAFAYLFENCL